ncbi:hypothetical protein MNB_SV-8-497 [hydrothermal vent metagenome]|uniref:Uncharacterized protein n=1 Tax=hydrothermal vent metagenome TaxID=652676 RepID=A0A1W1BA60_9ZZZZ
MKYIIEFIFDILFGRVLRKFFSNVDQEKHPAIHFFNIIGFLFVLVVLGYFIFFYMMFKDYKGG